ncbi:MAG: hypothetical protein U0796_12635 [Gemmatales bacterium]
MLTDFQKRIVDYLATETLSVALGSHNDPRDKERLKAAGYYAYALYCDLRSSGLALLEFSELMIKNRGLDPSNPRFFMHVSSLTDLVHIVSKLPSSSTAQAASDHNAVQPKLDHERLDSLIGLEKA